VFGGDALGVFSDAIAKRLREARVIENPDLPGVEIPGHSLRVAQLRQCALDHDSVEARDDTVDFVRVALP